MLTQVRFERPQRGQIGKRVRYAYLDGHPEHRFVPSHTLSELTTDVIAKYNGSGDSGTIIRTNDPQKFQRLGWKLGRSIRELTSRMARNGNDYGEQAPVAERLRNYVQHTSDGHLRLPSLKDIAAPLYAEYVKVQKLNNAEIEADNETTAARLLDWKIGEEICNNGTIRSPNFDFKQLWSFCAEKSPEARKYFDLNRWPVELQHPDRQLQIRNSGPRTATKLATNAKKRRAADMAQKNMAIKRVKIEAVEHKPKEKWHKGDCAFPFGETKWQQAWLSMSMDEELKDGMHQAKSPQLHMK